MKNKVSIVLALLMFLGVTGVMAQEKEAGAKGEKIKELRKAYIIEELNLTADEEAKFMPILETHHKQRKEIKKSMKELKGANADPSTVSEAEFLVTLDKLSDLKIQEVNLDKQFAKEGVSILGVERMLNLKEIEKKFRKEMREKRGPKGNRPKGGHEGHNHDK